MSLILRRSVVMTWACLSIWIAGSMVDVIAQAPQHRTFPTPEDAARALVDAAKSGDSGALLALFGPESQDLFASAEPATAQKNRQVFTVAAAEQWHLEAKGTNARTLVIGNEQWPFPVPLVKDPAGWRFDTAAGREEVLARRIGQNELAVIASSRAYVTAQRRYAEQGHDGTPAGAYATKFRSDPGKENGLYWPTAKGQKPSPLGDLVAQAETEGRAVGTSGTSGGSAAPAPFHGYYFRILTAQGAAAPGGAKRFIVNNRMSGGFALIAWPAQYNLTGVMTFIVGPDGIVREKDLGSTTDAVVRAVTSYNPDSTWRQVP